MLSKAAPLVFPPGCEHLDADCLLEGYTDRGEYAEWTADLEQSPNDPCKYRLIKLKNGLECMLVQNPTAETCAASMAVRVGHLQDPDDLPGLAHFLEHLLFMGSAKFPGENEYSDHLSNHNGWSNAYTSTDQTVYYFEAAQSGFVGALDRFSQFFVSPLFNENCVEREIKAVDSEHNKNLQNDGRRMYQVEKSLAKKDHVYHKFGTGNLDTLWNRPRERGVDIRAELIGFYQKHYSANLMKLVLVSSQPIEGSLAQALEYFNAVPNYSIPPTIFPGDPYDESMFMTKLGVKTLRDFNSLMLQFPFYNFEQTIGSRPAEVVSYLLSNGGPSSLYTFLKRKGLVTYLRAFPGAAAPGIYFFQISCGLTNDGLEQHQLVVATIFEYIKLLSTQAFPSWAVQELRSLLDCTYRFKESDAPNEMAVGISTAMHESVPRKFIFSGSYKVNDEEPTKIKEVLTYLVKDKVRVRIASQKPLTGLEYDHKEEWYGTEYGVQPLDSDWFKSQLAANEKLSLPEANAFIPNNLDLVGTRDVGKPFPRPLCIKQTTGQRIWWKQDDRWKVPRASFWIKMSNPVSEASPKNRILCTAWVYLVSDALEHYAYDASTAGLEFDVSSGRESLQLCLQGYTDKMMVMLKIILHAMKDLTIDQKRFTAMKEDKLRSLENESHLEPLKQTNIEFSWIVNSSNPGSDHRKTIWSDLTIEEIQEFSREMLSTCYVEALVHGNIDKLRAFEMVNLAEEILGFGRLPREALSRPKTRVVAEKSNHVVRFKCSSKEEVNNGVDYYLNVGHPDDQNQLVRLYLLQALIAEPCFNVLRTKEQLGYIVGAGLRSGSSHIGLRIVVQSARSPVYVETRIEDFLSKFAETLSSLDLQKFESAKAGLMKDFQEDHKNQSEESQSYWTQIDNGIYDFFRSDRLATMIKPLSLNDICTFFKTHIHPNSETCAKLSIHLHSQRVGLQDIDNLVEALASHGVDSEPVKAAVKEKILPTKLREIVDKHIGATKKDLHDCCRKEILAEVDKLEEFPDTAKDLPKATVVRATELRQRLAIGEERKPVGDFYDGLARL